MNRDIALFGGFVVTLGIILGTLGTGLLDWIVQVGLR